MTLAIAIVGGGPTGLACALLLARRGLTATVIEPRPRADAQNDGRLLALARGSWDVLHPLLGAAPPPMAPILDVHVSSAGEFGAVHLAAAELGAAPLGATVAYGDLVAALDTAADAQAGIACKRSRRVTALAQRPDGVTLSLDDGSAIDAAIAIHAEGGGTSTDAAVPWALTTEVALRGPAPGTAFERFTREGPLALLPMPAARAGHWALVWCATQAAVQRRVELPETDFVNELQQALGPRLARVLGVAGMRSAHPLRAQRRTTLVQHRAVWLGNAAQTLHPVAGQGFNLALRDAVVMADVLATHADVPTALHHYARRRRLDRTAIGAVTDWLPDLFATRAAPIAVARSLGLAALDLLPTARHGLARLLMFGVR